MGQKLLFYNIWPTLVFLKIPWELMQWHKWVPTAKASFLGKCPAVDQQLRKPGSKARSSFRWALCTQNRKGQMLKALLTEPAVLSAFFCIPSQNFSLMACEFQNVYSTWTKQKKLSLPLLIGSQFEFRRSSKALHQNLVVNVVLIYWNN